jgi:predicted dienelactone hydrolase
MTFPEPAHEGPTGQYLGQRTLVTQIWYPRARGAARPFPLLLFAPGFLQCPGAYSHLLQAWASAGYVVAAVKFPRTNCQLGAEAYEADLVNQRRRARVSSSWVVAAVDGTIVRGRPG